MYLLTYFRTESEALHYALSEDGLAWRALNGNKPVLHSTIGAQSIRDPFLIRDFHGLYHALSTNGWEGRSIWHAVSDDLVSWREETLLPAMDTVPHARNAWAPEAFYDAEAGLYRLVWASSTAPETDTYDWNHRIWTCSTADWNQFSAPEVFFDPGYSVIDATVVQEEGGVYLMAFKDERHATTPGANGKAICLARAGQGSGPWTVDEKLIVPAPVEGPALFRRADVELGAGWTLIYDFFESTGFGAAHSVDGRTWHDITARCVFPDGPRHAGVVEISDEEAARLESHFGASGG